MQVLNEPTGHQRLEEPLRGRKVLPVKLFLPTLPRLMVEQPLALEKLGELGCGSSIRIVQGSPGFGKTTLVSHWIRSHVQERASYGWVTLDQRENDPYLFLLYLIHSIQQNCPFLKFESLALLERQKIEGVVDSQEVIYSLLEDMVDMSQPFVLVLDDLHYIDNPIIWEALQNFIQLMPVNLELVLISRKTLPIRLAKQRASDMVIQVSDADLKFSSDQIKRYLKLSGIPSVSEIQLNSLVSQTEGWIAALALLINGAKQQSDPVYWLSQNHSGLQDLTEYLIEEVTSGLENSVKTALSVLSRLERFSFHQCIDVFGEQVSALIEEQLIKPKQFVTSLDSEQHWFKLHRLFAEHFKERPIAAHEKFILQRCAHWYFQNQQPILAIELALREQHMQLAADWLTDIAEQTLSEQNMARLLSWKQALPPSAVLASPRLIIIFSWALVLMMQLDEAESLLKEIDRFLPFGKSKQTEDVPGQLLAIRALIARGRGDVNNAAHLAKEALNKLPKEKFAARSMVMSTVTNCLMTQGNLTKAFEQNAEGLSLARVSQDVHLEMLMLFERARIEQMRGNIKNADMLLDQGIQLRLQLKENNGSAALGRIFMYKGYIQWLMNLTDSAKTFLQRGIQIARGQRDPYVLLGYVVASTLERSNGNHQGAKDALAQALSTMQRWNIPQSFYKVIVQAMEANLKIDIGDWESGIEHCQSLKSQLIPQGGQSAPELFPALNYTLELIVARGYYSMGDYKEALKVLDNLIQLTRGQKSLGGRTLRSNVLQLRNGFELLLALLLRAQIRAQFDFNDEALADFKLAIEVGREQQCLMPFIETSVGMESFYQNLPVNLKGRDFVDQVMKYIHTHPSASENQQIAQVKVAISNREMEVLHLIAQGYSNQEIADRLFISLHTVKTHVRRLNAKLEVKNRTQALVKASEIGLIS